MLIIFLTRSILRLLYYHWSLSYMHGLKGCLGLIFGDLYALFWDLRPYFSYYACFSLFGIFDCWFTHIEPNVRRKCRRWAQTKLRRLAKWGPIGPIRMIQGKNSWTKKSTKYSIWEASGLDWAGATTACGGGGTAVRPCPCRVCGFPSCPFVFLRDFSVFAFKRGCIWLKKGT